VLLVSIAEVLVFGAWLALLMIVQLLLHSQSEPGAQLHGGGR
jgi:hypothetical protein